MNVALSNAKGGEYQYEERTGCCVSSAKTVKKKKNDLDILHTFLLFSGFMGMDPS